jgi:hypothetical protein
MTREPIGTKKLFHCTNSSAYAAIISQGQMRPGPSGMFGAGIYFADSESAARHKCQHHDSRDDAIIIATVDMGRALRLEAPDNSMNLSRLRSLGCNSIKGRRSRQADWEYVVYESNRVHIELSEFITDIAVRRAHDQTRAISATPHGYTRHAQDLCQGTKRRGDYVYLSYKTATDAQNAITDIGLEAFAERQCSEEYRTNNRT